MLKNSMMILMIMLIASGDHDNSDVKDLTLDKHTDMQKAYKLPLLHLLAQIFSLTKNM